MMSRVVRRGIGIIPDDVFKLHRRALHFLRTKTNQRKIMKTFKEIVLISLLPLSAFG
jgi:hypothetical protein